MARWFRLDDDVVNDPKVQNLPDALFRAWINVLCIASKNEGVLPPLRDIAFTLRVKEAAAAGILSKLHMAGLLDKTETSFKPHNWEGRQFKSDTRDETAAERMQRYRLRKRNSRNGDVTVTVPIGRDTTDTDSVAKATGAEAPDPRKRLFDEGLPKLASLTGKGPDACRSFVGKCLKASGDDAVTVLGLIEDAERNRVADPSAWIAARLKPSASDAKPLTAFQQSRQQTRDILDDLDNFSGRSGPGGKADFGLLPGNSGQRSEEFRGGISSPLIDVS